MNLFQRLRILEWSLILTFACSLAISFPLWLVDRRFPVIPLFDFIPISQMAHVLLLFLMGLGLLSRLIFPNIRFNFEVIFFSLMVLIVFDLNRIQPWVFHFSLYIYLLWIAEKRYFKYESYQMLFPAFQWIYIAILLWSGLHKLNSSFFEEVVPYFSYPLTNYFPKFSRFINFGLMTLPFVEILAALGLLFQKTRNASVVLAALIHFGALIILGPFGHNSNQVIWPWNVFLLISVFILFFRQNSNLGILFKSLKSKTVFAVFFISMLMPIAHVYNYYDAYLSWDLYSGAKSLGSVCIDADDYNNKVEIDDSVLHREGQNICVDSYSWCMNEMRVPTPMNAYSQKKLKKQIQEKLKQ